MPESDEEKATAAKAADKDKEKEKSDPKVHIDLENIDQRIVALPIPNRNYVGLQAGKEGTLFVVEGEAVRACYLQGRTAILSSLELFARAELKLSRVFPTSNAPTLLEARPA